MRERGRKLLETQVEHGFPLSHLPPSPPALPPRGCEVVDNPIIRRLSLSGLLVTKQQSAHLHSPTDSLALPAVVVTVMADGEGEVVCASLPALIAGTCSG